MFSQTTTDAANPAVRIGLRKVMQPIILYHELPFLVFLLVKTCTAKICNSIIIDHRIRRIGRPFFWAAKLRPAASPLTSGSGPPGAAAGEPSTATVQMKSPGRDLRPGLLYPRSRAWVNTLCPAPVPTACGRRFSTCRRRRNLREDRLRRGHPSEPSPSRAAR